MGIKIPLNNYKAASAATRAWAKKSGVSPVKATKALSETTRAMIDDAVYRESMGHTKPNQNIVRGLEGLTSRLSTGNRSRRTQNVHNPMDTWETVDSPDRPKYQVFTHKGDAIDTFGRQLGSQLGMGNTYVMRPKPDSVFSKAAVAKKRAASKKAGPKGGMR